MKFQQIPYWKQLKMYSKQPSFSVQNFAVVGKTKELKRTNAEISIPILSRIFKQIGMVYQKRRPNIYLFFVWDKQTIILSQAKKQMMPLLLWQHIISETKLMKNSMMQQMPIFLILFVTGILYFYGIQKCSSLKSMTSSLQSDSFIFCTFKFYYDLFISQSNFSILFYSFIFILKRRLTSLFFFTRYLSSRANRIIQLKTITQKIKGIESCILKESCSFLIPNLSLLNSSLTKLSSLSRISTLTKKFIINELQTSDSIFTLRQHQDQRYLIGIRKDIQSCHKFQQNDRLNTVWLNRLDRSDKLLQLEMRSSIVFQFGLPYLASISTSGPSQLFVVEISNKLLVSSSQIV